MVDSARKINSCRRESLSLGLEGVKKGGRLIGMFASLVKDADGLGNLSILCASGDSESQNSGDSGWRRKGTGGLEVVVLGKKWERWAIQGEELTALRGWRAAGRSGEMIGLFQRKSSRWRS